MKGNCTAWLEIDVQEMERSGRFYESVVELELQPPHLQLPEADGTLPPDQTPTREYGPISLVCARATAP